MQIDESTIHGIMELYKMHNAEFLAEVSLFINYPDIYKEYQKKRLLLAKELRNTMVGVGHP